MLDVGNARRVYAIRCKENGKIYIGITKQTIINRVLNHIYSLRKNKHPNKLLQDDFNKYGENGFEYFLLEDDIPYNECWKEKRYMEEYNTFDKRYGYNYVEKPPKHDRISITNGKPENKFVKEQALTTNKGE